MVSYRGALAQIGEPKQASCSYRDDFTSRPASLQAVIGAMTDPQPGAWTQHSEQFVDEHWTEECQWVTWDGARWVFSSNGTSVMVDSSGIGSHIPNPGFFTNASPKALYRFAGGNPLRDEHIQEAAQLSGHPKDHLGPIEYRDDIIYCALDPHTGGRGVLKVGVQPGQPMSRSSSFHLLGSALKPGPDGTSVPVQPSFTAINPWDGCLYCCEFDNADRMYLYDPGSFEWTGRTLQLGAVANRVQGGCFSDNGHLYLACDEGVQIGGKRRHLIKAYSALNGHFYGQATVLAQEDNQELQGVCFARVFATDGTPVPIHVVLLENHGATKDNIFFKHFTAPDPRAV